MNFKNLFLFLFSFILISSLVYSDFISTSMDMRFTEKGTVTHYYGQYHVVQITGDVTISNPTDTTYFGMRIPFKDTVLNYKQIMNPEDAQYVLDDEIFVISILPNQSIKFKYKISGITNIDPVENGSVLRSILDTEKIISFNDLSLSLLKGPMEDPTKGGRPTTRVITVRAVNPTSTDVNLSEITVIKTPSLNITDVSDRWILPISTSKIEIPAGTVWEDDIVDSNAYEGEVYWVDYSLDLYKVDFSFEAAEVMEIDISLVEQLNNSNLTQEDKEEVQLVYILKEISSSVVQKGDIIDVTLTLLNLGNTPQLVNIEDIIPEGFKFYETLSGNVVDNIFKDNKLLQAGESLSINYSIQYEGGEIGLDFFQGATAKTKTNIVTSSKISFIKEYLPKEKLFVQKKVSHVNDDDIKIELVLKNIGQSKIKNVVLKEPLNLDDRFEMLSVSSVEKGVWSIPKIEPNDEFVIEYVTGSDSEYNLLPNVFGLSGDEVYKTLITSTVLKNIFRTNKTNSIEIVGILFLIAFVIVMLLINFGLFENVFHKNNSKNISNEINHAHSAIKDLKDQLKK